MSRTVYVNGEWLPEEAARISIFDRGFLFADAAYEVTAVARRLLLDFPRHAARLRRSLDMLEIPMPVSEATLLDLHKEIARRNAIDEGMVYLQVSRGAQDRNFLYSDDLSPTFVMFTQPRTMLHNPKWATGITMCSAPEGRWARRDIKSVQLLYSSLAKKQAVRGGFDDTLFVEDGLVTESVSANFHIVDRDGTLVTRGLSNALLPGITRGSIVDGARAAGMRAEERAFTLSGAMEAAEAFITDAINLVMPVVSIDRQPIGAGVPGPVSRRLRELYVEDRLANGIPLAT